MPFLELTASGPNAPQFWLFGESILWTVRYCTMVFKLFYDIFVSRFIRNFYLKQYIK